jgi:hypothetical protein
VAKLNVSSETLDEVRQELQRSWHHEKKYYDFPRARSAEWEISPLPLGPDPWKIDLYDVRKICNKLTCFYWKESGQDRGFHCNLLPLVGIYKEWFHLHDDKPDLDYGRFFANPVKITPGGPTTVAGILEAHRSLCELSTFILSRVKSENLRHHIFHSLMYTYKYNIPDLFRAVIIVHDEHISYDKCEVTESGKLLVDDFLEKQSVLLVRTGDESGLSAPISFDGLKSIPGFCPENFPKEDLSSLDTIRVSLRTAVRFIVSLEKREKDALLASEPAAETEELPVNSDDDESSRPRTQSELLDMTMQSAASIGYENDPGILNVLRTLEAYKSGQSFEDLHEEPYRFNRRWEW